MEKKLRNHIERSFKIVLMYNCPGALHMCKCPGQLKMSSLEHEHEHEHHDHHHPHENHGQYYLEVKRGAAFGRILLLFNFGHDAHEHDDDHVMDERMMQRSSASIECKVVRSSSSVPLLLLHLMM